MHVNFPRENFQHYNRYLFFHGNKRTPQLPHKTVTVTAVLSSYCGVNDGIRVLATCHDSSRCGPPLTTKTVVRLQAVACWICNRNWQWIKFLSEHFTIPQSIHFHHYTKAILHSYNLRRYAFSTIESVIK